MFLDAVLNPRGANPDHKASSPMRLVLLRQIHSGLVRGWTKPAVEKLAQEGIIPRGDGSLTGDPGLMLAIQTADCLPILVADLRQRVVAAFHAGWRGTLARIVERGVGRMRAEFRSRPEDLTAAIGPGIGRCCYAVGEELRMDFESQFHYADSLFHEVFESDPIRRKYPLLFLTARAPGHSGLGPQIHLDLEEANRRQLLAAGVQAGKIYVMGLCTACNMDRFFSYRGEDGFTGRLMSVIGRLN
jgi:YfiH family protein